MVCIEMVTRLRMTVSLEDLSSIHITHMMVVGPWMKAHGSESL